MPVGTGIESLRRNLEYRRLNNANLPKDGRVVKAATLQAQGATVSVLGVDQPVFVPGVSDPEGTGADATYIP